LGNGFHQLAEWFC